MRVIVAALWVDAGLARVHGEPERATGLASVRGALPSRRYCGTVIRRDQWPQVVVEAVCRGTSCTQQRRETLDAVVRLAVEFANEGREGRSVGTLVVVGDADAVLDRSRQLILDPLAGHDSSLRHIDDRGFRETVKELAQLDGAFVVDDEGTWRSAARFIEVDLDAAKRLLAGFGARHAAADSISEQTNAVAVAVSETSIVRVFAGGKLRAEIAPETFLRGGQASFAIEDAEMRDFPDTGLTVALAPGEQR